MSVENKLHNSVVINQSYVRTIFHTSLKLFPRLTHAHCSMLPVLQRRLLYQLENYYNFNVTYVTE